MRTPISNLNVIRATRVSGFLCNGICGMATRIVVLTDRLADTAWRTFAVHHVERREMFWKPLYASVGSPSAVIGHEKHSAFSWESDLTCPTQSRSWGNPQVMEFKGHSVSRTAKPANSAGTGFNPAG
ncbi:hypothetical protein [Aporhodopirellula aestuarii]|uniref:Uncharacterized protein n=1 Tax=Aporhodopirellula aestuarii TaxID=2950107 RepID=A0ABT0UBP7_9BACT|nr:hypothetical protein [Aporhodopirellula aestuarii]MCM2373793.1 hypothetical protein [Aporhodopirellula aestuarii]